MNALVGTYPEAAVIQDASQEREFEERLADSSALAFRVALGVLRNRDDAEDVAQEAFLRAYQNFNRLRDRDRFRAWLVRIAWRLALDRIRASRRRTARETAVMVQELSVPERTVEDIRASREFEQRLARAMDALPEKLRVVLVLGAVEGHDTREIGRLLELPEGTVKSRLFHARRRLAEILQ
jgi:RNA polymerase sigma-70 factor (ECF subfamily)